MEKSKSKRLVMVGIHRKGDKGFKTRIRKDMEYRVPDEIVPEVTRENFEEEKNVHQ